MSLNQIDTYQSEVGTTLLLGKTTDSFGSGVKEILASSIKDIGRIIFFYLIDNCCLHAQYETLQQSVDQVYGAGGLGKV